MSEQRLAALRDLIQDDINQRGLKHDPAANLVDACADDFAAACRSLASAAQPAVAIVTGFFIPTGSPPCGETDGPLGAVFLARALVPLGVRVVLVTDGFCERALLAGLAACGRSEVPVVALPSGPADADYGMRVLTALGRLTHLLAIERVGPSHRLEAIPSEHRDRCHTMRGRDVTELMSPAHLLFEAAGALTTLGIGDGGNEIGMGKIPWDVIRRNIPGGDIIACRIPVDHLIVCAISNWGAYALAAGVTLLRGARVDPQLFDPDAELKILQTMVDEGPLVDGVLGRQVATVDGLSWPRYADVLGRIATIGAER